MHKAGAYDVPVPKLPEIARNPLAFIAARWTPNPVTVRRAALAALAMSVVIVITGGAVRLTASGLGCPTWPTCSGDSLLGTREMGIHHAIEISNRMLTYVLCAAVGWAIIAIRAMEPRRTGLYRLAWAQFWVVVGNAVWGGLTVLTKLNPYVVSLHFLLSAALITVAVLTWQRVGEGDASPRPLVGKAVRQLGQVMGAATVVLIVVGTLVTGAGPHPGDSSAAHKVQRIHVDWRTIAQLHADFAWVVVGLSVALWFVLRAVDAPAGPQRRSTELFLVLMGQGVIGYVQYFTHLPAALVDLHMFGACLVWIATLRVLLSFRERPSAEPGRVPAAASAEGVGVREAGVRDAAGGAGRQPVDAARVPLADQGGDPLSVRR
ncbi:cytochrome c oxidase assembly protein subunit 15 [Actinacidiphila rubida]|uniref:Cytochrome c oxidase assembly protein subunit 15 n=1 Tax=Actinacidiphila rubida TaxID=310780 RepID=A0A1H8ICI3_9ACTN|nr:cytochrome c oxidase assembly protein subunit 15 [Actinacidiphila rubida]